MKSFTISIPVGQLALIRAACITKGFILTVLDTTKGVGARDIIEVTKRNQLEEITPMQIFWLGALFNENCNQENA
jgi:hypothetical protein